MTRKPMRFQSLLCCFVLVGTLRVQLFLVDHLLHCIRLPAAAARRRW